MKKLALTVTIGLAISSCGGSGLTTAKSEPAAPLSTAATVSSAPPLTDAPPTTGPAPTVASTTAPSTTVAPTSTLAPPSMVSTQCLLGNNGPECMRELAQFNDAGCPNPKADDTFATRTAILPCEYGYWVYLAESELARQGYPVRADGYYSSAEIPVVKEAQDDWGVEADGQIGPATWTTVMDGLRCDAPVAIQPPILQSMGCSADSNSDGYYDPGDYIPD